MFVQESLTFMKSIQFPIINNWLLPNRVVQVKGYFFQKERSRSDLNTNLGKGNMRLISS